ncbi:MAG: hypothetical protein H6625_09150 [Bdellovibrionaceae bacterium]|nr:hypothetical protein [Pseudobdellovibrionaceae bacterium]
MEFIYHTVPTNLLGNTLQPLFVLKDQQPSIFQIEIKKYNDHPKRKELPYKKIPKLNCNRGDVIHCSSIHPGLVFQALKSVFPDSNRSVRFFKIPLSLHLILSIPVHTKNSMKYLKKHTNFIMNGDLEENLKRLLGGKFLMYL